MSGTLLGSLAIVISMLAAIATVYFMARQSTREAERLHRQDIADAVNEATAPLQAALTQMIAERNYQRDRADRLAEGRPSQ